MSKLVYFPPSTEAAIKMQLETDLLLGPSAIGFVLATGQGIEEYLPYSDAWEDDVWD